MKKKLAVKIVAFGSKSYCIKYCIYRFFPLFYYTLDEYSGFHSIGMDFAEWVGSHKDALTLAESLTIDSIREWQQKEWDKYKKAELERIKTEKLNHPYRSKRIK